MLYDELKKYSAGGIYPMHMPGHKRNAGFSAPSEHAAPESLSAPAPLAAFGLPYDIDITEIHGFDDLRDPHGILMETENLASELYGSHRAFMLVNGSTAGVMAAIGAHARHGDKILMARNCHLSVYNAVALFELKPIYVTPKIDECSGVSCSIDPAAIEAAMISDPDIKLVVVTSPTYEGVAGDIGAMADIVHEYDVPLLVDAAHGAHFGFSKRFPESAVHTGADIVVMSLHKTLPALTQCALLHVGGKLAKTEEIARYLSIFQTTSPSYVLMASIDRCIRLLADDKERLFRDYEQNLDDFNARIKALSNFRLLWNVSDIKSRGFHDVDIGKLVIVTKNAGFSGIELSDILRVEFKIELEMSCGDYALGMTSICDTQEGFARLADALLAIDGKARGNGIRNSEFGIRNFDSPKQVLTPGDALMRSGCFVPIDESFGAMSLEYVWAYPPGVPVIAPGEIINESVVSHIVKSFGAGIRLKSTGGKLPEFICVAG